MKKNRIIACIMILTMLLTSGVGNIGEVLTSFAQGKNNIIITDILNEKPLPTLDNKFLLEQNIEKISDTQLKINLKITGNGQDVNMKNTSVVNTLCDNLEICTESINISGIENSGDIKWKITSPRDKVTIDLGDIYSKEVNISFEAKIRNSAEVGESIPLNLKADIKYMLDDSEEEVVSSFPIPKFNLVENVQTVEPKEEPKVQTLSEDTTSNVETYSTRQTTTKPNTLPFPVTIRDFNADYIFFELENKLITADDFGGYGMIEPEISDEGKPVFTDAQVIKMAKLLEEKIYNIKIPNDFTSKSTNDSDRILASQVFEKNTNLTDQEKLTDAKKFYEDNKDKTFSSISPDNTKDKNRLNTVYRYIYYYVNKLFVDTEGLNKQDDSNEKIKELNLKLNNGLYTYDYIYDYDDMGKAKYPHGFFPIDDEGFKQKFKQTWVPDDYVSEACKEDHNFHFTLESNTKFYFNAEDLEGDKKTDTDDKVLTFEFSGDDDVWVYINDNLVIDLGGQHLSRTQRITIDKDGTISRIYDESNLDSQEVVGQLTGTGWYDFDFFFIERHTHLSNFKITTNIEFKPEIVAKKEAYIKKGENYESIDIVYPEDTIYYKFEATNNGLIKKPV